MAAWESIAATLRLLPPFGVNKDGKACYSRFTLLVRNRRDDNTNALRRSGSAEQYEEKETLLDDIILQMEAHHADVALASSQRQERNARLEASGRVLRDLALGELSPPRSSPQDAPSSSTSSVDDGADQGHR
ncbi:TPA: hypothetical protein N0F65_012845 [Lagenidium giganteum]|uniref:Uncharacterized protein n=1 Tax=Lagenidium giganteum TaxID=4803 RepID=A0AAV2YLW9_9STRA|nr:TPA: hypothetical protein N0F65_012845 [Lagenidium giganteum]